MINRITANARDVPAEFSAFTSINYKRDKMLQQKHKINIKMRLHLTLKNVFRYSSDASYCPVKLCQSKSRVKKQKMLNGVR